MAHDKLPHFLIVRTVLYSFIIFSIRRLITIEVKT